MTARTDDIVPAYLRHGRLYGVGPEFWEAAASELDQRELQRLAAELDARLPSMWAIPPNRPSEPASQAGLAANKSRTQPVAPTEPVSSTQRSRLCGDCGKALPPMNTSGLCRGCYQRQLMRTRRAA